MPIACIVQLSCRIGESRTDAMNSQVSITEQLLSVLIGKRIKRVTLDGEKKLSMAFSNGTALVLEIRAGKLITGVGHDAAPDSSAANAPTKRQLEYLLFIAKYVRRFSRAPAESDIERHFLVAAPSVNQMMQTLERRGFISRQPGVPRSTKICIDLGSLGMTHE